VPIVILLVIAALGPAKWVPRSELGWQFDHFIGYFGITLLFCFAPRPFLIGGSFMAIAALLEGLQAFTPDRTAYLPAVFYGAGGALAAALVVELFMRAAFDAKEAIFFGSCAGNRTGAKSFLSCSLTNALRQIEFVLAFAITMSP
jgi:VanZ family protein